MSYTTWYNYGYGFRTDNIHIDSVERLKELIHLAPEYESWVAESFADLEITSPTVKDYLDLDEDYRNGIATILAEVIQEVEHIPLTHCDDFDGKVFLIYQPSYPWNLTDAEKSLTLEKVDEILRKYAAIVTDEPIEMDDQEVENGG